MTGKELVLQTLQFENPPRAPRELWALPWAWDHYPRELEEIYKKYPSDFTGARGFLREAPKTSGDPYEVGEYVDEWGCVFTNRQKGVIGEVKHPLVTDEEWEDVGNIVFPRGLLTIDAEKVNRYCHEEGTADKFIKSGCCPRPFEQLQFIRGTENFFVDLALRPPKMMKFIALMHEFYCELLHSWAKTEVDALNFMDDWGTQRALLIHPDTWREIFKPMYTEYVSIAHSAGKKIFMHSDGHILEIMPDLVEIGVDAVNSQIFCMGIENLRPFAGKITFWGEIDRQHLLSFGTPEEVAEAVKAVKENLWRKGGCIAQMEFSAGGRPENVAKAYETWEALFAV